MNRTPLFVLNLVLIASNLHGQSRSEPDKPRPLEPSGIKIRADFPGGNVLLERIDGRTVHIAPDLRGGRQWFYWNFAAEVDQPARLTFEFPAKAGAQIGMNGPAFSEDDGRTWDWLGVDNVRFGSTKRGDTPATPDSFTYDFKVADRAVRFAVGIPYQQRHLEDFVKRLGDNPHLSRDVLTRSRKGRPVEVWQIGRATADVTPVLVSARHHACEAMASYVLEGFLNEALSDSRSGRAFRRKHVLYAVPIVDVDGVAEGDPGKWRNPHDHNRDYGWERMLYPPVISMVRLAKAKKIELALDFHCPTLRMDIHQGFYFAGLSLPHIKNNMDELISWMDEERPRAVIGRERDLLSKPGPTLPKGGVPFSNYFAYQPGMKFAATLESPYTQRGNGLDEELARTYGKSLLRAWVRTEFVGADPQDGRSERDAATFTAFRKSFTGIYMSKPSDAEAIAARHLSDQAPALYRIEANNLMGTLRFRQRKYDEAREYFSLAMTDERATTGQVATAASERARIACADLKGSETDLARALADFTAISYPSAKQLSAVHQAATDAYTKRQNFHKALSHARLWFQHAGRYERGKALNVVADLHGKLGRNDEAITTREQAVSILRAELDPVPVGVFGPLMAADLLDALNGIPTATVAEKKAAANIALNHKVKPPSVLRRIRDGLRSVE